MSIAFQVEVRHKGVYRGRVSPHQAPIIIGASRGADVYLADGSVAGEHAEVVEGPDGMVLVRDLGGPGGVRVNGMRLRNAEVRPGDCISVGNYALVVVEAHQTREIVDAETWVDLPSSQRDEGEPCIEMYVLWNDKVQEVRHFRTEYRARNLYLANATGQRAKVLSFLLLLSLVLPWLTSSGQVHFSWDALKVYPGTFGVMLLSVLALGISMLVFSRTKKMPMVEKAKVLGGLGLTFYVCVLLFALSIQWSLEDVGLRLELIDFLMFFAVPITAAGIRALALNPNDSMAKSITRIGGVFICLWLAMRASEILEVSTSDDVVPSVVFLLLFAGVLLAFLQTFVGASSKVLGLLATFFTWFWAGIFALIAISLFVTDGGIWFGYLWIGIWMGVAAEMVGAGFVGYFADPDSLPYTISERPGSELLVPDGVLGRNQIYTMVGGTEALSVNISHPNIEGEARLRSGQIIDLKTAKAQTGGCVTVEQGVRLRIDLGPFTFLIQGTNSGPKPKRFAISRDVATVLLILALSFLGHSGFMIGLQLVPEDGLSLSRTDYQTRHGVVEVLKIAYEAEEPEEPEELEFVKARRVDDDGKGDEDQDSKNKNRNPLVDKLTPEQMRKRNEELAYSSGLSKAMRDQSELIEQALSGIDASGYDSALRALAVSSDESDDRASTNLGLFSGAVGEIGSDGSLGGLPGASTAGGMGGANGMVAGLGKSDVSGDHVRVRFSNQRRQRALVKTGRLTVRGGYDAGIIRRYIKSKLNELRWCHRQAIQRDPNVAGKITVKFIIQPNGIVPQASIVKSSTTTSAPDLEFCITSKIKFWRFPPPPQAGASAVVTYPFIFKVMR